MRRNRQLISASLGSFLAIVVFIVLYLVHYAGNKMAIADKFQNAASSRSFPPTRIHPGTTPELFKKCAEEILAGQQHSAETGELGKAVRSHFHEQLKPRKQIAPGLFATNFSHIADLKPHGVLPEGSFRTVAEDIMHDILEKSLAYAENDPHGTPPSDVITLNQVMNGLPPTPGAPYLEPNTPLHGSDVLGNKIAIMLGGHSLMDQVISQSKEHRGEVLHSGTDDWAWARATWMSVLMQKPPEELGKAIKSSNPEIAEFADQIEALARALQTHGPDAVINRHTTEGKQSTFKIKWPESANPATSNSDCETVLKNFTATLMETCIKKTNNPKLAELSDQASINNAKIFLLSDLFASDSAFLSNRPAAEDVSKSNGGRRALSLSQGDTDAPIDRLGSLNPEDRAMAVYRHIAGLPLIAQQGSGYSVQFALPEVGDAAKKTDAANNDASKNVSDDDDDFMDAEETFTSDNPTPGAQVDSVSDTRSKESPNSATSAGAKDASHSATESNEANSNLAG